MEYLFHLPIVMKKDLINKRALVACSPTYINTTLQCKFGFVC